MQLLLTVRQAHNPEVTSSNLAPATFKAFQLMEGFLFSIMDYHVYALHSPKYEKIYIESGKKITLLALYLFVYHLIKEKHNFNRR